MSGIIYKLFIEGKPQFYIGATNGTIETRIAVHKYNIRCIKNKMYEILYGLLDGDTSNLKFVVLEVIEDGNDLHKLHKREYETIQEHMVNCGVDNCLNTKFKGDPLSIGNIKQNENITKYNNKYYHSTNKYKMLERKECNVCKKTVSMANYTRHLESNLHNKKLNNI
jgi:hypothetical protein